MVHVAFPGGIDGLSQLLGRVYQQPAPRLQLDALGRLVRIEQIAPPADKVILLNDGWLTIVASEVPPRTGGTDVTDLVDALHPIEGGCTFVIDQSLVQPPQPGTLTARLPMDASTPVAVELALPEGADWPTADDGGHSVAVVQRSRPCRLSEPPCSVPLDEARADRAAREVRAQAAEQWLAGRVGLPVGTDVGRAQGPACAAWTELEANHDVSWSEIHLRYVEGTAIHPSPGAAWTEPSPLARSKEPGDARRSVHN